MNTIRACPGNKGVDRVDDDEPSYTCVSPMLLSKVVGEHTSTRNGLRRFPAWLRGRRSYFLCDLGWILSTSFNEVVDSIWTVQGLE